MAKARTTSKFHATPSEDLQMIQELFARHKIEAYASDGNYHESVAFANSRLKSGPICLCAGISQMAEIVLSLPVPPITCR
jgi:hypothetical protein